MVMSADMMFRVKILVSSDQPVGSQVIFLSLSLRRISDIELSCAVAAMVDL